MSDSLGADAAPAPTWEVFISYAAEDLDYARAVRNFIRERGRRCFLAADDLNTEVGSERWGVTIDRILDAAPVVVLIVSPWALDSKWVEYEWRSAHEAILSGRAGLIIPLCFEGPEPADLPRALRVYQCIDVRLASRRDEGLANLDRLLSGYFRKQTEAIRALQARKAARIAAEQSQARLAADQRRLAAAQEQTRVAAEQARRAEQEQARLAAERARLAAEREQTRVAAEQARRAEQEQAQARLAAEQERGRIAAQREPERIASLPVVDSIRALRPAPTGTIQEQRERLLQPVPPLRPAGSISPVPRAPASTGAGCAAVPFTIASLAGAVLIGWFFRSVRQAMGPYADGLAFFLLGTAGATLGTELGARVERKWIHNVLLAMSIGIFSVCGAFVGCDPGGKHSSMRIGGDDVLSVTGGGVLGLVVGGLITMTLSVLSVERDRSTSSGRRLVRLQILIGVLAFLGAAWRTLAVHPAYAQWRMAQEQAKAEADARDRPRLERLRKVREGHLVKIPAGKSAIDNGTQIVEVAAFSIDDVEVGVGRYMLCVLSQKCSWVPGFKLDEVDQWKDEALSRPIEVLRANAEAYCTAQGKRLPTQAEWLLAAFGADLKRKYPWGSGKPTGSVCAQVNLESGSGNNGPMDPCAVGSSPGDQTPEGVFDLGYNVREFVVGTIRGMDTYIGGDHYWGATAERLRSPDTSEKASAGFRCAKSDN